MQPPRYLTGTVHEAGLGALHRGWVELFHGVSLKAELAVWVTTASGALRNWLGVTQFREFEGQAAAPKPTPARPKMTPSGHRFPIAPRWHGDTGWKRLGLPVGPA